MGKHTAWTYQICADSAAGYKGRGAWARDHHAAYRAAQKNGWIDSIFPIRLKAVARSWDFDSCVKSAAPFSGKGEWSKANPSAYQAARKEGWLDAIFPTRKGRLSKWTLNACMEKAKEYSFQKQWQEGHPASFYAAYREGFLEQCTEHMGLSPRSPSDYDCIYMWESTLPGVYKIGITSQRLGKDRILKCSYRSNMECKRIVFMQPADNALAIEKDLLGLGEIFDGADGDGRTEFRVLSNEEAAFAEQYALAA